MYITFSLKFNVIIMKSLDLKIKVHVYTLIFKSKSINNTVNKVKSCTLIFKIKSSKRQ